MLFLLSIDNTLKNPCRQGIVMKKIPRIIWRVRLRTVFMQIENALKFVLGAFLLYYYLTCKII